MSEDVQEAHYRFAAHVQCCAAREHARILKILVLQAPVPATVIATDQHRAAHLYAMARGLLRITE